MSEIKRLTDIAQRLDELSDEGPDELSALSEEMGGLLDRLETQINNLSAAANRPIEQNMPEYLRRIQDVVEREIRGTRGMNMPRNEREMQRMYEDYLRYSVPRQQTFKPISVL